MRNWLLPRVLELVYTAWDLEAFGQDCDWRGPPFRWGDGFRERLESVGLRTAETALGAERPAFDFLPFGKGLTGFRLLIGSLYSSPTLLLFPYFIRPHWL